MHSVIRWQTVSSPTPHGHIGVVAVGMLTPKRKACSPIFPVQAWVSIELSAFFRPMCSLYWSSPSLGLGKSAAGKSRSHRWWAASSLNRFCHSWMTISSGVSVPVHRAAHLDLRRPLVATGSTLLWPGAHVCACVLPVRWKKASVPL